MKEDNLNRKYDRWIRSIARTKSLESLIKHLREHVGSHYDKYNRSIPLNRDVWLVDILNFMHILEKKNLKITEEDLLFKLALHYRKSNDSPKPDFDSNFFIQNYKGRFKKFDALSANNRRAKKIKKG